MLVSAVVAGLLVGLSLRGDLRRLAAVRVRWWPLFLAAVALRFLAWAPLGADPQHALYVASLWLLFGIALRNLALPGVRLAAIGTGLNALVITANGGAMPVWPDSVRLAGSPAPSDALHRVVESATAVALLGDVLPIPFLGTYSAGDVLLALGVFVLTVRTMKQG